MSDKISDAIHGIAVRHGVVLSKDDPILILQTMNDRLMEENRQAQALMLAQFREEIEYISSQWKDDAKEKAEKILNAALASSKEAMANLFQESIKESVTTFKNMLTDSLVEARHLSKQTRKFGWFALLSLTGIVATTCFFVFYGLFG